MDKIFLGFLSSLATNYFFKGKVEIGKYCQIGFDVALHSTNRPISHLTFHINQQLFEGELKNLNTYTIEIGNYVCIGQ